jgi:hypothetical protein
MHLVEQQTIEIVRLRHLLPRWDLATHLGHGWLDYHLLVTGQILRLLADLWLQGYWPPGLSIYQVPFYVVLGGDITSGLWSTPVAFVLACVTGSMLLWRLWGYSSLLSASLFLALLMSSPFLLAHASVAMTEMLGVLGQLFLLLCYVNYRQHPGGPTARLFAISLTLLFFIKYNYFVLLVGPLLLHEWLERTSCSGLGGRLDSLWGWTRWALSSPTGAFVAVYFAAVAIVLGTGGFDFRVLGQRVSVHTIGNSGHVVLYICLLRLWYQHRRGRIDWNSLMAADVRIRPLLIWFVVPVTIWFASPYPNHIRDFANLMINRQLGEPTVGAGVATYLDALRTAYFYAEWVLIFVVAAFVLAAVRYRSQPPVMQWLILAIPLQFAAIAVHQTRFPRFLLLTVVLLCLAGSSEVGRWVSASRPGRLAAGLLAPIVLAYGVMAAQQVVAEERFRVVAFEHYTDSQTLRAAFEVLRAELNQDDRLVILGQSNDLSPGLFRWELGPPSGVPCFPFQLGGSGGLDLALATRALILVPLGSERGTLDAPGSESAHRHAVQQAVARGDLVLRHDIPVADMHVALRLYHRTSSPARRVECR